MEIGIDHWLLNSFNIFRYILNSFPLRLGYFQYILFGSTFYLKKAPLSIVHGTIVHWNTHTPCQLWIKMWLFCCGLNSNKSHSAFAERNKPVHMFVFIMHKTNLVIKCNWVFSLQNALMIHLFCKLFGCVCMLQINYCHKNNGWKWNFVKVFFLCDIFKWNKKEIKNYHIITQI